MTGSSTGERLADVGYRAGWRVVRLLPGPVAHGVFRLIADVIWRRRGAPVLRLEQNLRPVLPADVGDDELRRLSRLGLRSYLRYWCEAFRLPTMTPSDVASGVTTVDVQHLDEALARGNGVVCALPHMGNWDLAGAWLVGRGHRFATVAERLRPASLFDQFVAYREQLGMEVLAALDPDVFGTLADRLRSGQVVCLVADRDLSAKGLEVTMGRGRTRMPAGPAALAVRTGAALLPVTLAYDGPHLVVTFHPAVERPGGLRGAAGISAMTQQVADAFGAAIAAAPQDWHMLQRFWVEEPA